jgi:hypothetical protein
VAREWHPRTPEIYTAEVRALGESPAEEVTSLHSDQACVHECLNVVVRRARRKSRGQDPNDLVGLGHPFHLRRDAEQKLHSLSGPDPMSQSAGADHDPEMILENVSQLGLCNQIVRLESLCEQAIDPGDDLRDQGAGQR